MATVPNPSSLIRMIFARHACFCGEPRFATMASSRILSVAVTSNVIPVRMPDRCTCENRWESNIGLFCLNQSTRTPLRSLARQVCTATFGGSSVSRFPRSLDHNVLLGGSCTSRCGNSRPLSQRALQQSNQPGHQLSKSAWLANSLLKPQKTGNSNMGYEKISLPSEGNDCTQTYSPQ